MFMLIEGMFERKACFIVPYFNLAIISACDYVGLGGVDDYGSHEVMVSFKVFHLLHSIVVEDADVEVIGS